MDGRRPQAQHRKRREGTVDLTRSVMGGQWPSLTTPAFPDGFPEDRSGWVTGDNPGSQDYSPALLPT